MKAGIGGCGVVGEEVADVERRDRMEGVGLKDWGGGGGGVDSESDSRLLLLWKWCSESSLLQFPVCPWTWYLKWSVHSHVRNRSILNHYQ